MSIKPKPNIGNVEVPSPKMTFLGEWTLTYEIVVNKDKIPDMCLDVPLSRTIKLALNGNFVCDNLYEVELI